MKSQCTKAACVKVSGGKRPEMLVTTNKKTGQIPVYDSIYSGSNSEDSDDLGLTDASESEMNVERELDIAEPEVIEDYEVSEEELLEEVWTGLSPPTPETDIQGRWLAAIYTDSKNSKSIQILCVGRVVKRFLDEKDGKVTHVELDCLKPRVGNTNILQECPRDQPDVFCFNIQDIIGGPLRLIPIPRSKKWRVPEYEKVLTFFDSVKQLDRVGLFNSM